VKLRVKVVEQPMQKEQHMSLQVRKLVWLVEKVDKLLVETGVQVIDKEQDQL
jgi:hypothetical protein